MLIVISPAKTLDFDYININTPMSEPRFLEKSKFIMDELKKLDVYSLSKLMKISDKLATLNRDRFEEWTENLDKAKQCLLAFNGDVYRGLDVGSFTEEDLFYADSHLRILSGLYGVLRPFDGINPYRLEMGTKIKVKGEKDLYKFWGNDLRDSLMKELSNHSEKVLVNLASHEYFKSVEGIENISDVRVITPTFKEWRNGKYKIISLNSKRARGLMTRYIIQNQIDNVEIIKDFSEEGYTFSEEMSEDNQWIFIRE